MSSLAFTQGSVDRNGIASADTMTAAFSITVPVGGFSDDIYIPVLGVRSGQLIAASTTFTFEIEAGYGEGDTDGVVTALAISQAEIVDGMYRIPANTRIPMTFIGLMRVSDSESDIYRMRITELPFYIGDNRETRGYSSGELKYLVTNYEALNFIQDPE